MSTNEITQIKTFSDFEKKVIKEQKKIVLVDFFTPWCGPCQIMGPLLEKIAKNFKNKIIFYKVNIDKNQDLANKYHILSIPTLIIFKKGQIIKTFLGLDDERQITKKLENLI